MGPSATVLTRPIADGIFSVGVVDWNVRTFHGNTYSTARGSSYNSYLIMDEKIALVDLAFAPFGDEFVENIRRIVDPARIDYIIANHVETDHSGALPLLRQIAPRAQIIGTAKCKEGLSKNYFLPMDFRVVKTGEEISLGRRTLRFIEAPMIHWPDSMFTYIPQDAILMPNDAFGQHMASNMLFADEVDQCALWDEAEKYYANILWPLGGIIGAKLAELKAAGVPVSMIAPSHGLIWRKEPQRIVEAYARWAANTTRPRVVIAYDTMWGSTDKMARAILEGVTAAGVEGRLFDIGKADRTTVITSMLEAKVFALGSSTHDNDMLPGMAGFLHFLKGLKPKKRSAAAFGSYGWAGGAVKGIEAVLAESGIALCAPSIGVRFVPSPEELTACRALGAALAREALA